MIHGMDKIKPQHSPRGTGPVAALRLKRGLTRPQLCAKLRAESGLTVHPNSIGLIEAGRAGASLELGIALAKAVDSEVEIVLDAIREAQAAFKRRQSRRNGRAERGAVA